MNKRFRFAITKNTFICSNEFKTMQGILY